MESEDYLLVKQNKTVFVMYSKEYDQCDSLKLYLVTGTFFLSDSDSSVLGPDMALSIEYVLKTVPQRNRDTEHKQVSSFLTLQNY